MFEGMLNLEKFNNNPEKREWLISIIIGIRKEVLIKLRKLSDSYDREKYTSSQRKAIAKEIKEIAELVSEKEKHQKKMEEKNESKYLEKVKAGSLVDTVRNDVLMLLNEIRAGVLAIEYDGEYAIIDKELTDIAELVKNKDRLIRSGVQYYYRGGKENPYLRNFFKIDDNPELE